MHAFAENPNLEAKIAFLVWTPFHYYVYKNIIRHLPEAEFIICDTWYAPLTTRGPAHIENSIRLIERNGFPWRVCTELSDGKAIERFFKRYEIIAAIYPWPPLDGLSFDDWFSKKKSVRIKYGVGKNISTFAPWSAYFDITLVEGPHAARYLRHYSKTYVVGAPKFDDWFSNTVDPEAVARVRAALNPKKETVLYLPTHGGLSSLPSFGAPVADLAGKFNIIVKLHNHSPLTEKRACSELRRNPGVLVFDECQDILPLFSVSDAVLSDSSSANFEAVLIRKPLVTIDMSRGDAYRLHQQAEEFNGFWHSGGLVAPESAVEKIKQPRFQVGEIIRTWEELEPAIRSALSENRYQKNQDEWIRQLFAGTDGKAGERAARIIRNFLTQPKPAPTMLGRAARAYLSNSRKDARFFMQKYERTIRSQRGQLFEIASIRSERSLFRKAYLAARFLFRPQELK